MQPVHRGSYKRTAVQAYMPSGGTAAMTARSHALAHSAAAPAYTPYPASPRTAAPSRVRQRGQAYAIRQAERPATLMAVLKKLGIGVFIITLMGMGMWVVSRSSQIARNNNDIYAVKQEIEQLTRDNETLQLQILQANPLERVMRIAQDDLGMQFPEAAQTKRLSVDVDAREKLAVQAEVSEETVAPDFWSMLLDWLQ